MNTSTMELNLEQMGQVTGAEVIAWDFPTTSPKCFHPNKVKTSIGYEDEFFFSGPGIGAHTFARIAMK